MSDDMQGPKHQAQRWNPSKTDWHEVRFVLIAGGLGGLASWVYGLAVEHPVAGGIWAVPMALFLGAFAAGIGVYVLTNTNTAAVARTLCFAALCGFAWKPVCDAGFAYIDQAVQRQHDSEANAAADQATESALAMAGAAPEDLPRMLEEVQASAEAALEALPRVSNLKVRREIEVKVNDAMRKVSEVASRNPPAASSVMLSVAETAARSDSSRVSARAVTSLESIAATNIAFTNASRQLQRNITESLGTRFLRTPANLEQRR